MIKTRDDNQVTIVPIYKVEPKREQPRKVFDDESIMALSESIQEYGLLQPIVVQDRNGFYEIIAGERRWRACKKAGLKEIPVIIKDHSEQEILEISLIENIQRENLNPIDEALAYKRLQDEFHLKQEQISKRVSKSRVYITNSLRLLKLDKRVMQMVIETKLSMGHAKALLGIDDNDMQFYLAERVIRERLSVRELEKMIRALEKEKEKKAKKKDKSLGFLYKDIEERLKQQFSTKVTVSSKGDKGAGKIELEFYSHDDLERLLEVLENNF